MLKEEYNHLKINDLVCRYYTVKDEYKKIKQERECYIVTSRVSSDTEYFFARTFPILSNNPNNFIKLHYSDVELATTEVIFDEKRMLLYREFWLKDLGKNYYDETKKNKIKILRIKPINSRELFIQFKGEKGRQGVIPYYKFPLEIVKLDIEPEVFDRAYIRRDGWLAWFIHGIGEYALSPKILYDLL